MTSVVYLLIERMLYMVPYFFASQSQSLRRYAVGALSMRVLFFRSLLVNQLLYSDFSIIHLLFGLVSKILGLHVNWQVHFHMLNGSGSGEPPPCAPWSGAPRRCEPRPSAPPLKLKCAASHLRRGHVRRHKWS